MPVLLVAMSAMAEEGAPKRGVVLFVGDGMGVSTVTAARILDGQNKGLAGEENLRNLAEEWVAGAEDRHFVFDQNGFDELPATGQVLGLFDPSHMEFEADREHDAGGEPSLAEMTAYAVQNLSSGPGFFLVVEGAASTTPTTPGTPTGRWWMPSPSPKRWRWPWR